jgi:hypothetical protein
LSGEANKRIGTQMDSEYSAGNVPVSQPPSLTAA